MWLIRWKQLRLLSSILISTENDITMIMAPINSTLKGIDIRHQNNEEGQVPQTVLLAAVSVSIIVVFIFQSIAIKVDSLD